MQVSLHCSSEVFLDLCPVKYTTEIQPGPMEKTGTFFKCIFFVVASCILRCLEMIMIIVKRPVQ